MARRRRSSRRPDTVRSRRNRRSSSGSPGYSHGWSRPITVRTASTGATDCRTIDGIAYAHTSRRQDRSSHRRTLSTVWKHPTQPTTPYGASRASRSTSFLRRYPCHISSVSRGITARDTRPRLPHPIQFAASALPDCIARTAIPIQFARTIATEFARASTPSAITEAQSIASPSQVSCRAETIYINHGSY